MRIPKQAVWAYTGGEIRWCLVGEMWHPNGRSRSPYTKQAFQALVDGLEQQGQDTVFYDKHERVVTA